MRITKNRPVWFQSHALKAAAKWALITAAGYILFRIGQYYALRARGYEAVGGEYLLLLLPLWWKFAEIIIRDTIREFRNPHYKLKGEEQMNEDIDSILQGPLHERAAADQERHGGICAGMNAAAAEFHRNAVAHGWYEQKRSFPEVIALMHSELSEALEEYRNGKPMIYAQCGDNGEPCEGHTCDYWEAFDGSCKNGTLSGKPEGIAVELADCIIRILDTCAEMGIDIEQAIEIKHEYNKSRPYRHGGKKC